jgi:hypothetical protein
VLIPARERMIFYPVSLTAEGATLLLESSVNLTDWIPASADDFQGLSHNVDSPTATAAWSAGSGAYYRLSVKLPDQP